MSHTSRIPSVVSVACALLLAACGGGDGTTDSTGKSEAAATEQPPPSAPAPTEPPAPPAPADPATPVNVSALYEGRWKGCALATDREASWSGSYTFTRLSDTKAGYHFVKQTFAAIDCTGAAEGTLTVDGEVTWTGKTRTVAGVSADEVLFTPADYSTSGSMPDLSTLKEQFKQVLALSANVLREGDRAETDADGYPVKLSAIHYANDTPPPPPPVDAQ